MEGLEGSSDATGWIHLVRSEDGETAICKTCDSTLKRHIDSCCSREYDPPAKKHQRPAPPPASCWFNQEECTTSLARMIAFHGHPSSIVDDECFRSLLHGLNPFFQIPSRAAVEHLSHRQAEDAMAQLKETLARCPGRISLATGVADTGEGRALYIACQFVDGEWAFQKRIMQVFRAVRFPPRNHSALLGADEVCLDAPEEALQQFSLPRTSGVLEEAARRWGLLPGRLFSVAWCQEVQERRRRRRQDFLDRVVPVVTYTSDVLDSVAALIHKALDGGSEVACFDTLKSLQLSHEELARRFSELGLDHVGVGRYDKRWYSYYCALEVLHKEHSEHNPALDQVEEEGPDWDEIELAETLSGIRVSRERSHMLSNSRITRKPKRHRESLFKDLLRKIFGTIYRAIDAISSPSRPSSSLCLVEVKKVRDVVQSEAMDACRNVAKAIAYSKGGFSHGEDANVVLLEAQGKLDRFLEESYLYLSIPAVLDPRFKLEGVRSVFSEVFDESAAPANIAVVEKKIEDMFCDYGKGAMAGGASAVDMDVDSSNSQESTATVELELEHYLEDGVVVGGGLDVLQWWKENKVRYPTVARMAMDALVMPASDLLSPQQLSCVRSMARSYCVTYPSST